MKHPYLAKLGFPLLCAGVSVSSAFAQGVGTVSGRILDEKNEGMPGVTVLIEGTTLGGSTNSDGTFSIQGVPAGQHTIVTSFVGYTTRRQTIAVTSGQNTTVAPIALAENTTLLNEAVVVGYGTQRRQDVTGAVATVQSKDFVQGQVTNPEQLVQGKIAGVSITTGGGAPGAPANVRIRGNSSLNASNDPLYVIDGVPVDKGGISGASNPLTLINPNDIESVTVLKDASATAIYGNRASNGVILITTKKGLQGEKLTVNVSSQTSIAKRTKIYDVLGAQEFSELIRANGSASQIATLGSANTNWQEEIFRTATTYDNNVSLIGSVGKLPFRVSYGNLNQEGIVITNKLKRNSGSISLNPVLFDDHLRIDLNVKGTKVDNRFIDQSQIGNAVLFDPTQPVRGDESRYAPYGGYFQFLQANGNPLGLAIGNPVAALNNTNNTSEVKRLIGNVQFDYKIHGVEGLRANLNLATDVSRGEGNTVTNLADFGNYLNQGRFTQYNQKKDMRLLEAYLAYSKQFGGTKFDIQAGHSYQDFVNKGDNFLAYRFDRTTLVNPSDVLTVPGYYSKLVFLSYFGRTTLNVKDRYLLTATVRNDNTSRFASGNRSGVFPAVGLGWRLKGEEFLANNNTISELKLRAGWGRTGQQDVGGAYDFLPRYVIGNSAAQYNGVTTYRPSGYNVGLQWETTTTWNAGLDYGFLDNRISGSIDAYERTSTDLLSLVNVPAGSNLTNQLFANVGSLRNRGLEFNINVAPVRSETWNWDFNFNAAYNVNKITDLGDQQEGFEGYLTGGIPGGTGSTIQVNTVGYPSNSFYVRQQVYGSNGRPVEGVYVDRNGDGIINERDNYRYKNPAPRTVLGFSSNVAYKKINLSFLLRGNVGNYVYNSIAANLGNFSNAQGSTNYLLNLPTDIRNTGFNTQQLFSDYYVENGSFLRCENITLGYNVGKLFNDKANLRLSAAVQNAFLITKYNGLDPEIFGGIDNNFYPRARTFTFGLNLGI
ncbi:SusC/RagA family TonB-linked outer membrane protein [Hymenobacter taeanensis]|uniref:SusC/RagA family TonB-linked outer membrane protein n=1 Tax=Hymenobacter taeanensis TaxID=2735321 RepID=A0A6M6BJB4_9BACT|nr:MULTISPECIES: SusC/RagA family TonB-linked outer membrane protein [Hymenobacter]QJX48140.1 SusC/RagA family TonB-linked outer membrane protein [Hymenobacter taeanensis]UOQ82390.1 SusC/RagA family TonB-linked outer membrane protein [Hymenobacter sp. 5414T-23]